MKRSTVGRSSLGRGMLMIYGAGASALHERQSDVEKHVMTVHVAKSDSASAFGHMGPGGEFEMDTTGFEGSFRVRGGDVRHFAIRDTLGEVFALDKVGTVEFGGPAMPSSKAIFPVVAEPYYSIASLRFAVQRDSTVTVELVASSPNGFAEAD